MIYYPLPMFVHDVQLSPGQILSIFHHDEPYLILGCSFSTVGLLSAAFCLIRKKFDALLVYFALFAFLYGQRLLVQMQLLSVLIPPSNFFQELRSAIDFVVPIPAVLFFDAAGLIKRGARYVAYGFAFVAGSLALATIVSGTFRLYQTINTIVVIIALVGLLLESLTAGSRSKDFVIIRRGLLTFIVLALWDNIAGTLRTTPKLEPFGFAVFLGTLGYVAARRALERDQQLTEIHKELEVARRIQQSILPAAFPDSTNFRVAARYVPMTSVAGDFYDFIVADNGHAGLLIADASGHGIPAALIASMVKLAATSQRLNAANPSRLLSGMNAALCGNTQNQFVSAAYVYLDSETREIRYSAAGHPPMLLLRSDEVIPIEENGLLLAIFDCATYSNAALPLHAGDRLLLYTDGIVEAANQSGEFFGHAALCNALRNTSAVSPSEAAERIIASVQQWAPWQEDDLTVLVCDYLG
jgi:phosphoserine phosphatase RsbU/P